MNEPLLLDNILPVLQKAWPDVTIFAQVQLEGIANFQNNVEGNVYKFPLVAVEITESVDWEDGSADAICQKVTINFVYYLTRKDAAGQVNGRQDTIYGLRNLLAQGRNALIQNEPNDGTWQLIPPYPTIMTGLRNTDSHWYLGNMDSILGGKLEATFIVSGTD